MFIEVCSGMDCRNNLYSTLLTRSEFWVPARGIAYTNITNNVIPSNLCKYTLFSKSEDHIFLQPVHLRPTRTIVTQRIRTAAPMLMFFKICVVDHIMLFGACAAEDHLGKYGGDSPKNGRIT